MNKPDFRNFTRSYEKAVSGDEDLGPLKWLPGTWENVNKEVPNGWNMIALPFATQPIPFNYRVLANHYSEVLKFEEVDKGVPNRGVDTTPDPDTTRNQFIVTLDYIQKIEQVAAEDNPVSGNAGGPELDIHHEPGLFLYMTNLDTKGINIARLGSVPHGNSLLALGHFDEGFHVFDGPPNIPDVVGMPTGVPGTTADNPYLAPYKHFEDNPFRGTVQHPDFDGFVPSRPAELLKASQPSNVVRTTQLGMSTNVADGDISNIPFIVREADATLMESVFWIMELDEPGIDGQPKLMLQYLQTVMLDFFPRRDGSPGKIGWPHVSINTMVKTANPPPSPYASTTPVA